MIRSTGAAILLLSLATSPLLPQSGAGARIAGTVRSSATKSVLPGAVVSIPSLGAETTTDSLGRFTLTNLASGARSLEVRAVGRASLDGFDPTQIEAIEYYTPAQTPSRFKSNENTSCGTIVLWQRS